MQNAPQGLVEATANPPAAPDPGICRRGQVTAAGLFTASQIARALGMKRQAAQRLLSGIAPSGQVIVKGRPVKAWTIFALSAHSQELLASRAEACGYRSREQLVSAAERWEPPFPLAEVAQHSVDKAAKLQRAMARVLELQDDLTVPAKELEGIGLEDYQREFGRGISARHLRNLVKRTLDRDGGAGQFAALSCSWTKSPRARIRPGRQSRWPPRLNSASCNA